MRVRKDVERGMLVTKRRGWIVPMEVGQTPIGFYEPGYHNSMMLLNGERTEVTVRPGVIFHGQTRVRVKEDHVQTR